MTLHNTVTSHDTLYHDTVDMYHNTVDRVDRVESAASGKELLLISLTTVGVRFRDQQETN